MTQKILFRGAEAIIYKDKDKIIKKRNRKTYRLGEIDERIRKLRTRSEGKLFDKASKIISVPKLDEVNEKNKEIVMDFVNGEKISDNLNSMPEKNQLGILRMIGNNIAKIHDSDIIHGDLTTSNMIFNKKENKVYFIDFGLGFQSQKVEDKAVDLHLLKQALETKHFLHSNSLFKEALKGYEISKNHKKVLEQFKKVEKRGRYKENY